MEYKTEEINADDYCSLSVDGDYFVTFCDPPLPSFVADNETIGEYSYDVILLLDTSGSMYGQTLANSISAMNKIIGNLPATDNFNIIRFGNNVRVWRKSMISATKDNKFEAESWLSDTKASGATDLKSAIDAAIDLAETTDNSRIPVILFITDGGPHVGENNFQTMISAISDRAAKTISINGISLGSSDPMGWQLVQRLSARNRGLSTRMFDISRLAVDIPRKFLEIKNHARSLRGLTDISFTFDGSLVHDLTNTDFADYAAGADLVVLGRFKDVENIPEYMVVNIEYKDVEKKVWKEKKVIKIRKLSGEADRTENIQKFAGEQMNYNPIKQQWAVTAVHQLLQKRSNASSQQRYDALTLQAKKLSMQHNIVSPVVSFLVKKPKSSINLINTDKLDGRMKRDAQGRAEIHQVRYQYRKLWWRSNSKDELEKSEAELEKVRPVGSHGQNWVGIGSLPVKFYLPMSQRDETCLTLPKTLEGKFTIYAHNDLTTSATIKGSALQSITFRYGDTTLEITTSGIRIVQNGEEQEIDENQEIFKIDGLVVENQYGEIVVTHISESVQFHVQQKERHLDVKVFGMDSHSSTGLLAEFGKIEASLIESQSVRKHQTSTLWINGQYIPVSLTSSSFGSNEECWNVNEESSARIFHN